LNIVADQHGAAALFVIPHEHVAGRLPGRGEQQFPGDARQGFCFVSVYVNELARFAAGGAGPAGYVHLAAGF
jgi:hypothetical protein